ncbi:growth arrest-specific protein 1-like [Adelges cooleyi]|uniref:growth arrest-specific protein 1-like n=1 Tax=Adelges cooleyi TaxID=133065 RepID=UPI00217FB433|nr:growth arrest-specific protein 1-like [Adelges cooleyi]
MKTPSGWCSTTVAFLGMALLWIGGPTSDAAAAAATVGTAVANDRHSPTCEEVRVRCAFGSGCSVALHNYFTKCDQMLRADSTTCPESCLYALVSITSTEEGKKLLDCTCRDRYCEETKARVEVCRPLVLEAVKNETIVSCELAQWICAVDPVCSAALGYYHTYCKRMIQGVSCTERCLNSINILQRQEKAVKMNRCRCSGAAAGECLRNKERMARLCYGEGDNGNRPNGKGGRKNRKKHRPKAFEDDPDRSEIEVMLVNGPDYQPDERHRYNAAGKGSAVPLRSAAINPLVVVAAAVLLVKWSTGTMVVR